MISFDVPYEDWDGNPQTTKIWFHVAKSDLLLETDILELQAEAEAIQKQFEGEARNLEPAEVRRLMLFVKKIMGLGIGQRTANSFRKSDEIREDFFGSPVYDAFILQMFEQPKTVFEFVENVFPRGLLAPEELAKAREAAGLPPEELETVPQTQDDGLPAWISENRVPTAEEFAAATPEQKNLAFSRKASSQ